MEGLQTGQARPSLTRTQVVVWDAIGGVAILLVGSFLHFAYELSGFSLLVAPFGSVNESTWEHLKLFIWPGLGFAVVQHAYVRDRVVNFWQAKALSLYITAAGVTLSFYAYLGVVYPIDGKGTLAGTIVTGIIGIVLGQAASTAVLTGRPLSDRSRAIAIASIIGLIGVVVLFTFAPPHVFLFENFFGYRYTGEYGILPDYEPYRVFR